MSNTISWGKIYESTNFGNGVTDNTISWGKVYSDLVSPIGGLLTALQSRSAYFENSSGTTSILQEFENCSTIFDLIQSLIDILQSRSSYSENTTETYNILEELKNCE